MTTIKKISITFLLIMITMILFACTETVQSSLSVSGDYKDTYYLGQSFDPTGLIVTYHHQGQDQVVTDYELSGFNSSVIGVSTVTVTYQDTHTSFTVTILSGIQTSTELKIYDMPDILQSSKRYDIKVEDSSLFVYETLVNHQRSFTWVNATTYTSVASFDFLGKVHVEITILDDYEVTKASVHPLIYEIDVTVSNNVISFDLEYPANYTIQLNDPVPQTQPNGSVIQEVIHLFANPIEEDPITA